MTESLAEVESDEKTDRVAKKGCLGWLWRVGLVGLLVLGGFLLWFNGPGVRMVGPKVAERFLENAGIEGEFEVVGSVSDGLGVENLRMKSDRGVVKDLEIGSLELDYKVGELMQGKMRGIKGRDIRAEIRLEKKEDEEKQPFDFEGLGNTLRDLRERVMPVEMDLENVTLSVEDGETGEEIVSVESTDLKNEGGSDKVQISLGEVEIGEDQKIPAQEVEVEWTDERLSVDALRVLPNLEVEDLEIDLPKDGEIAGRMGIEFADGRIRADVGPGLKDVRLEMMEGEVDLADVMEGLSLELPLEGRVTSLSVGLEGIFPEWQNATGSAEVMLEDVVYDGWEVPEVTAGLRLEEGLMDLRATGEAMGTDFRVSGEGEFERSQLKEKGLQMGLVEGDLEVGEVDQLLGRINEKLGLELDVGEFPESELTGEWKVELEEMAFQGASLDARLMAVDADLEALDVTVGFSEGVVDVGELSIGGLDARGRYSLEEGTYEGEVEMVEFDTRTIEPWLGGFGVELPGHGIVTMDWEGSGGLEENVHTGAIAELMANWEWKAVEGEELRAPIRASGEVRYAWPQQVQVQDFLVESDGQSVALTAALQDDTVALERLVWTDGETELLEGAGVLPVPKDFREWRKFLSEDERPLKLAVQSRELSLQKLSPWVPEVEQVEEGATGKVDLLVTGSLAEPEVEMNVAVSNFAVAGKEEIPSGDFTFEMEASGGVARMNAELLTKDYAPVTLEARSEFFPKRWVDEPESIKQAEIEGRVDLPRVNVAQFAAFLPEGAELAGNLDGTVDVDGTIGEPEIRGDVSFEGGSFTMDSEAIPRVRGVSLDVKADMETVEVRGSIADIEGGNVQLNGKLQVSNPEGEGLGPFELSVTGRGLPVMRNDFILLRAHADLRVAGTMDSAAVSGEVGVIDSIFYKDIELIPIGAPFLEPTAASLPKIDAPRNAGSGVPAPFDDWTLNVVLKTVDPILVRGNIGTGRVEAGLRVEGTLGDPRPNGVVRIDELVAKLPFTTLEVTRGTLTFTPETGLDPVLEVRARAEPRPYRVSAFAYGNISDPQLALTSQPPLPENEIMTLLATGTTTEGLEDAQAASNRAMQLLIEELRRGRFLFGKQLRPVLSLLDDVDFSLAESNPYDSRSYSSATLKLANKWYISAGLGAEGDQRILGIWRHNFR